VKPDVLNRKLRSTGRLALATETGRASAAAVALLGAALLAVLFADAVFALSPVLLVVLDCVLILLAVGAAAYVLAAVVRNWYRPRRVARMIERRMDVTDSRLINSVDLSARPPEGASGALVALAVGAGERLAATVRPARVVAFRPLRKAALLAALVAVVFAGVWVSVPELLRMAGVRLADPYGRHPPFTFIRFDCRVAPERVFEGRPATITAALAGGEGLIRLPDQANVVLLEAAGQRTVPMVHQGEGRFVLQIERASRSCRFYVDTPAGRSAVHELRVLPVPRFVEASVRYQYPPYTRWAPDTQPVGDAGIRALAGTQATVTVRSNLPLARGRITLIPTASDAQATAVELAVDPADPKVVRGSFPVRATGRYRMSLLAANGGESNERPEGPMTCVPDAPPAVRILEPDAFVVAPEDWKVPVTVAATDDVAVARIELLRSVNGWGPVGTVLDTEGPGVTYVTARSAFDLPALGVRPGDILTYFATARDSHPSGTQVADSPTFVIHVISKEEYLKYARMAYRMQHVLEELDKLREKLEALEAKRKELIEKLAKWRKKLDEGTGRISDEDRERLDKLELEIDRYTDALREVARQLEARAGKPRVYDFEEQYFEMLKGAAERLRKEADEIDEPRRRLQRLTREKKQNPEHDEVFVPLSQALRAMMDSRYVPEEGLKELRLTKEEFERLRKADALLAEAERILAIAKQQRSLADRMGQFRNKERLSPTEQIRARRLAADQRGLERDLAEALRQLEKRAKDAEADLPTMAASARQIVQKANKLEIRRDQKDAARLAEVGDGRYAHRAAEQAAKKLESLIQEEDPLEGMTSDALGDLDGEIRLVRTDIRSSLRQLAAGRSIPGLPGGDGGSGFYGSRARMRVVGPHSQDTPGRYGREVRPRTRSPVQSPSPGERIEPGPEPTRRVQAAGMPGVPVRFRPLAEAYFRRLGDESR
jgi:hypothetical protein